MRHPIDEETEIIVLFKSRSMHERFCQESGSGSRFIYRTYDDGRIAVLCRLDRRINRYGELITNPMWIDSSGKPVRSTKITPLERHLLELC